MYLLKFLAHPGLTQEQRVTGEMFKSIMLSLNLQSMRLNAGDYKVANDEEVRVTNLILGMVVTSVSDSPHGRKVRWLA